MKHLVEFVYAFEVEGDPDEDKETLIARAQEQFRDMPPMPSYVEIRAQGDE